MDSSTIQTRPLPSVKHDECGLQLNQKIALIEKSLFVLSIL
eukprot:UN15572